MQVGLIYRTETTTKSGGKDKLKSKKTDMSSEVAVRVRGIRVYSQLWLSTTVCKIISCPPLRYSEWRLPQNEVDPIFTARCYASAVLAMALCLSVRLSVRPSQAGVLLKRQQNIGSHKQHPRYVGESSFLLPKISAKFDRGHPLRGRQMQVGWVKIGNFRQISGYISKTVQDRHI